MYEYMWIQIEMIFTVVTAGSCLSYWIQRNMSQYVLENTHMVWQLRTDHESLTDLPPCIHEQYKYLPEQSSSPSLLA